MYVILTVCLASLFAPYLLFVTLSLDSLNVTDEKGRQTRVPVVQYFRILMILQCHFV